jgi:hypothetical protein
MLKETCPVGQRRSSVSWNERSPVQQPRTSAAAAVGARLPKWRKGKLIDWATKGRAAKSVRNASAGSSRVRENFAICVAIDPRQNAEVLKLDAQKNTYRAWLPNSGASTPTRAGLSFLIRSTYKEPSLRELETYMAKKRKRTAWSAAHVQTLKSMAKKKTPATKIAKALKRTEGATRQKAFSIGLSLDSR